ncbi:MAG: TIGR02221 family CRISPR-associated protein [Bacteroidota bacterium]
MPNTLLTFLGTRKYTPCQYSFNGQLSHEVRFVQQAMIEHFCQNWSANDRILVFLTRAAREKHWDTLQTQIPEHLSVQDIDIPDGLNEEEIWRIFTIVFEKLNEGDKVVYDITHGFRSLPMLGITLLNYAKFLKNIEVNGIYYGAYEARNKESNAASILDLTSFSTLQDWSIAAGQFLHYGITDSLKELTQREYVPFLKQTKGEHKTAFQLKGLSQALEKFSASIQTSDGPGLIESKNIRNIRAKLQGNYQSLVPAFQPLLEHINASLANFDEDNNIINGFKAVKWCIKNNLIQQGFTLLQENIITYIAVQNKKNYMDKQVRNDISRAFTILSQSIPEDKWEVNNREFVHSLFDKHLLNDLKKVYGAISQRRNELNHARFNKEFSKNIDYKKQLSELFGQTMKAIN